MHIPSYCLVVGERLVSQDSDELLVIPGSSYEEDVYVGIVSWDIGCAEPGRKLFRGVSSCSAFLTNLTDSSDAFLVDPCVYSRIEEEFDSIRFQVYRLSSNPPEYFSCAEGEVTFNPAPTAAPTLSPGPYAPCNMCGGLKSTSNPGTVWDYSSEISLRCCNLELNGAQDLVYKTSMVIDVVRWQ